MKVLIFASGNDTGGVAIAIKKAFDHCAPDWEVRSVRYANRYGYPSDITYSMGSANGIAELFAKADVVHVMENASRVTGYDGFWQKPLVLHHHGTFFREHSAALQAWAKDRRAVQLVSTIDLLGYGPDLTWLPSPVDTTELFRIRLAEYKIKDRLLVAHAPTSRELKGTDAFLAAMARYDVDLDLIEGVDWQTCLARKANADIVFDQATLGYGQNALEAWAFGIPVLSGAADWRVTKRIRNTVGYLPYHPTTEKDIVDRLGELITDERLRSDMARIGLQYVMDFHAEAVVVEKLKGIYEQARAQ